MIWSIFDSYLMVSYGLQKRDSSLELNEIMLEEDEVTRGERLLDGLAM